ncbi:RHS repeat-associated core domain-containing protein [Teredinibacter sp. KSP-S5-2]|uniref:RHS repeat domain-containing protein n=1 Tax=Teredinibacter sp. KSP-S5-2 TaxID=3034506 RepID=UPI0029346735|nr:RHS repeat-associated core domain-containing protein [Teredinibacter sp. KSP-S5-2]WNO10291.1 RHS repeat-associated core domain-containing protein [Teredinibacter sp. KSP-S5-2]
MEVGKVAIAAFPQNGADAYSEYYVYDKLHRLTQSGYNDFIGASIAYSYNASGNLLSKSDYARNYDYTTGTSGGPNAVKRIEKILKQANGTTTYQWESFSYDARGNMLSGDGLTQAIYNAMDKPTEINKDGALLTFDYGPSQMRYRQVKSDNGDTTTTRYIGKLYEEVTEQTSIGLKQSWRAYIGSTAVVSQDDSDGFAIRYQHRDRLGSARTFTDEAGSVVARRDYDPFGKPRMPDGTLKEDHWMAGVPMEPILDDLDSAKTPRGFTDHEHLDSVQYIHMNGRVYDYNLGRFLSVDPYVQEPGNSQGINPYSYILNNPLAGTDPTGYSAVVEKPPTKKPTSREIYDATSNLGAANGYKVEYSGSSSGALSGLIKKLSGKSNGASGKQGVTGSPSTPKVADEESKVPETRAPEEPSLTKQEPSVELTKTKEPRQGESETATIREPSQEGGVDQEGIPTKLKLHIGDEQPNNNTVVTDGKGGMMPQLSTKSIHSPKVIQDAILAHEEQHIKDFLEYGTNLDVLKGQPAGKQILFSPATQNKNVLERRGYRTEINFLKNASVHPDLKLRVDMRLNDLENFYNKYSE